MNFDFFSENYLFQVSFKGLPAWCYTAYSVENVLFSLQLAHMKLRIELLEIVSNISFRTLERNRIACKYVIPKFSRDIDWLEGCFIRKFSKCLLLPHATSKMFHFVNSQCTVMYAIQYTVCLFRNEEIFEEIFMMLESELWSLKRYRKQVIYTDK